MKILIATPLYPPELGKPASYVRTLAERLCTEHEVTIVTYANHFEPIAGVRIVPVSKSASLPVRLLRFTRALVTEARRADVIYTQRAVASGLPALIASKITKVPYVVHFFEDEAWERFSHTYPEVLHQGAFRRMQKVRGGIWGIWNTQHLVLRHAHRVIVPTTYVADDVPRTYGTSRDRMAVNFVPPEQDLSLPFSVEREPHKMVMVAPLLPWSDVEMAIRTTSLLAETFPDVHLYVVGDGPLREELALMDTGGHVTFLGAVSKAEELYHIRSASVFLSTASYAEKPDVLLEALREGVPCVATDVPGQRETFTNEESGLFIPPGDARVCAETITKLFTDASLQTTLGTGAKRLFDTSYTWDVHTRNLMEILEETL